MTESSINIALKLPPGDFLTPKELAGVMGCCSRTIIEAVDAGELGAFHASRMKRTSRKHYRIPRAQALQYLISHQTGLDDICVQEQLKAVLDQLSSDTLDYVIEQARRRRNRM